MTLRSGAAAFFDGIGTLLFGAAYLASVILSYSAKGLGWAIATAIPVVGQLLWFTVMWSSEGLANWYSILLGGAVLCFALSRSIGGS